MAIVIKQFCIKKEIKFKTLSLFGLFKVTNLNWRHGKIKVVKGTTTN